MRPAGRFKPCSLKAPTPGTSSVASLSAQLHASFVTIPWLSVADTEVHAMLGFPDSWSKPAVNQVSEPETKAPDRLASSSTSIVCANQCYQRRKQPPRMRCCRTHRGILRHCKAALHETSGARRLHRTTPALLHCRIASRHDIDYVEYGRQLFKCACHVLAPRNEPWLAELVAGGSKVRSI